MALSLRLHRDRPLTDFGRSPFEVAEGNREQVRQLPEDRASCSQDRRTSPLLGHWAGEWPRSQQEYAANQLASGELASNRTEDHELSTLALPPVFPGLSCMG